MNTVEIIGDEKYQDLKEELWILSHNDNCSSKSIEELFNSYGLDSNCLEEFIY